MKFTGLTRPSRMHFFIMWKMGLITLVGATTENPSFEVIPALVSRCRVFTLKSLEKNSILAILNRALTDTDVKMVWGWKRKGFSQEALAPYRTGV
jgi:putative ATPase